MIINDIKIFSEKLKKGNKWMLDWNLAQYQSTEENQSCNYPSDGCLSNNNTLITVFGFFLSTHYYIYTVECASDNRSIFQSWAD